MGTILNIVQILTGIAAVVSLSFAGIQVRYSRLDREKRYAENVAQWAENNNLVIVNNNKLPVYNAIIVFASNSDTQFDFFSIKHFEELIISPKYIEIVSPGEHSFSQYSHILGDRAAGNERWLPELFFTDSNNVQWRRCKNGKLVRLSSNENYIVQASKLGIILKHV